MYVTFSQDAKNQSISNKYAYFIESLLQNATFSYSKKYVHLQNLTPFFYCLESISIDVFECFSFSLFTVSLMILIWIRAKLDFFFDQT